MKNRLLFLLLSFAFLFSLLAHAQKKDADGDDDDDQLGPRPPAMMKPTDKPASAVFACPYEKDFQQVHKIGDYTLRLLPVKVDKDDKDDKDGDGDPRCRAVLSAPHGRKINIVTDWALAIDPISGTDINGDGKPEIVINGYSGGLRCCYTSYIISLDRKPRLLHSFHSSAPVAYEKQPDGITLIRAADGVFDYFIVPHAQATVPTLLLQMKGDELVDVSAQHPELYDQRIARARSMLTPAKIADFREADYHKLLFTDQYFTVEPVLNIVLDYVYSGREEQGWAALHEYWPPADEGRVKSLIIERRKRGLRSDLRCDCRPALVAKDTHHAKRKPSPPDETTDPRIKAIIDD